MRDNRGPEALIFLISNKIDIENPQVDLEAGQAVAANMKIHFEEVSAKSGKNILQLFRKITKALSSDQNEAE